MTIYFSHTIIKINDTLTKVTSKEDLNMNSPVAKKEKPSERKLSFAKFGILYKYFTIIV